MSRLVPSLLLATAAGALSCVSPPGPLEAVPGIDEPRGGGADGWLDAIDPASCPGGGPRLVRGAPATWTVMHYAAGDNDLEEPMLRDINEMELGHGGSPNVNVVVQLDRRTEDGAWRYEIRPDTTENDPDRNRIVSRLVGHTERELDSGDVATFTSFGRWAVACYPAERYVVVIGGHGKGWSASEAAEDAASTARSARAVEHGEPRRAIAPDDRSESEIYVDELAAALAAIRAETRREGDPPSLNRLVLYGSDACLMGTIEVAYDLRDAVSYLVGSEAAEPIAGWPYSTITRELTRRPSHYAASPERLAAEIVAAYGRSYTPTGAARMVRDDVTIAALDTAGTARVRDRVDRVASLALSLIADDREGGDEVREALAAARATSPTFGLVYTDLGGLLASFRAGLLRAGAVPERGAPWEGDPRYPDLREAIDDLLEGSWDEYVVASHVGEAWAGGMGLGVYMPAEPCARGLDLLRYERSAFARETAWPDLVRAVVLARAGEVHGRGVVDATLDGTSFSGLEATCTLAERDLTVEAAGSDGEPVLTLVLTSSEEGLRVLGAEVDARHLALGFRAEAWDLGAPVDRARFVPGVEASGAVSIDLVDRSHGAIRPLQSTFECSSFEPRCAP